jgi:hypothetical protein
VRTRMRWRTGTRWMANSVAVIGEAGHHGGERPLREPRWSSTRGR